MKRLIIVFFNACFAFFLTFIVCLNSDILVNRYYPMVAVMDAPVDMTHDELTRGLNQHIQEKEVLIARRLTTVNAEGREEYTYEFFGEGEVPAFFKVANSDDIERSSYADNYYVIQGHCTAEELSHWLKEIGMTHVIALEVNKLLTVMEWAVGGTQGIAILIFMLLYIALCVVEWMNRMRSAGIQIISGVKMHRLFLRPIRRDVTWLIGVCFIAGALGALVTKCLQLPYIAIPFYMIGLLFLNGAFACLTIIVSLCFFIILRKTSLIQLIKRKYNYHVLSTIVYMGQVLAIVAVVLALSSGLSLFSVRRQLEQGREMWEKEAELVPLTFNREMNTHNREVRDQLRSITFDMLVAGAKENKILLSHYYSPSDVKEETTAEQAQVLLSSQVKSTLIVTPNYLEKQSIDVPDAVTSQLCHLNDKSAFLLLPASLKNQAYDYLSFYRKWLTQELMIDDGEEDIKLEVSYITDGQECFLYNYTPIFAEQIAQDPVLIVLTPSSTGEESAFFGLNQIGSYLLVSRRADVDTLLQRYNAQGFISTTETGQHVFLKHLQRAEVESVIALCGVLLALLASFIMFNALELLYFSTMRRELFIKRVSGCTFIECHKRFLFTTVIVILLGATIGFLFTQNLGLSIVMLLCFTGSFYMMLIRQNHLQQKMTVTVLKGE